MINGISKENNKNKDLENNYMTSFCHTQFLADDVISIHPANTDFGGI